MSEENKKLNFINKNIIYIHGDFDESISTEIIPVFDELIEGQKDKKEGKIIIDIDSRGGYTKSLKDLLVRVEKSKDLGIVIETRTFSCAYSCGSLLACSGSKGYRFIGDFSEHLCHLGSSRYSVYNDVELERVSGHVKRNFNMVRSIYKKYAKIPDLEKVIQQDCLYIAGQQIIDWGLADKFYVDDCYADSSTPTTIIKEPKPKDTRSL